MLRISVGLECGSVLARPSTQFLKRAYLAPRRPSQADHSNDINNAPVEGIVPFSKLKGSYEVPSTPISGTSEFQLEQP